MAFFDAYREQSIPQGTLPIFHVQDNHSHIRFVSALLNPARLYTILIEKSNVLSFGTTDSAQAEELLEFMRSCVEKVDQRT